MAVKHPEDFHVYLALVAFLRQAGVEYPSTKVDCRIASGSRPPTYEVTTKVSVRAPLARALKRVLRRTFDLGQERWILTADEARVIADSAIT